MLWVSASDSTDMNSVLHKHMKDVDWRISQEWKTQVAT